MKYFSATILFAISTGIAAAPQVAVAEEIVTFKLRSSELESAEGRAKLLVRIKSEAKDACAAGSSSVLMQTESPAKCRQSLQSQWITAIGSPALAVLFRTGNAEYATAAR